MALNSCWRWGGLVSEFIFISPDSAGLFTSWNLSTLLKRVLPMEQRDQRATAERRKGLPRPRPCTRLAARMGSRQGGRGEKASYSPLVLPRAAQPLVIKVVEATETLQLLCRRCCSAEGASSPPGSVSLPGGFAGAADPPGSPGCWNSPGTQQQAGEGWSVRAPRAECAWEGSKCKCVCANGK